MGTADKPRSDRIQKNDQSPLTTMHTIWIAYGSNQQNPVAQLNRARRTLAAQLTETGAVTHAPRLYGSRSWGCDSAQPA